MDLGPGMLAHTVEYGAQCAIGFIGHCAEHVKGSAMRIFDIRGWREQWAHNRRRLCHRPQALLNSTALHHAMIGTVRAQRGELRNHERSTDNSRGKRHDLPTLRSFETQDEIRRIRHVASETARTERTRINADARHECCA